MFSGEYVEGTFTFSASKSRKSKWCNPSKEVWKSKTKQRMVLRMIHIRDSLLPNRQSLVFGLLDDIIPLGHPFWKCIHGFFSKYPRVPNLSVGTTPRVLGKYSKLGSHPKKSVFWNLMLSHVFCCSCPFPKVKTSPSERFVVDGVFPKKIHILAIKTVLLQLFEEVARVIRDDGDRSGSFTPPEK